MENEKILQVLTELLQNEKQNAKLLLSINAMMNYQEIGLANLEQKLDKMKTNLNSEEGSTFEGQLFEKFEELKSRIFGAQINNKVEK